MDEATRTVFYETRRHIMRPYTPNYPPQQFRQTMAAEGAFDHCFPFQLRDKWSEYKQPRKLRKLASFLFGGYKFDEHDRDSVNLRLQFARYPGARSGGGHRGKR